MPCFDAHHSTRANLSRPDPQFQTWSFFHLAFIQNDKAFNLRTIKYNTLPRQ
jgi:hypothetical protein